MIDVNKTNFTGNEFTIGLPNKKIGLFFSGAGSLAIQAKGEDGVWRSFTDLTFSPGAAQQLSLPVGTYRPVLTGGPGTIEVRLQ